MFLLAPVWRDSDRFPTFTAALVLVNVAAFAVLWPMQQKQAGVVSRDRFEAEGRKLVQVLLADNSGLNAEETALVKEESEKTPFPSERLLAFFKKTQEDHYSPALTPESRYRWDTVYPVFEAQERSIQQAPSAQSPYDRFGFKPHLDWWPGIITHQFLHAGFLHLFFNMLFLWVIGGALEQQLSWGLPVLYVVGGIAGALAQAWHGVPEAQYMVGASAAVSALMGFALLAASSSKVRLAYVALLGLAPKWGAFDAPLWFFIPLWLFEQVFMASMTAKSATVSIAYFAHLGGFALGLIAAAAAMLVLPSKSDATSLP